MFQSVVLMMKWCRSVDGPSTRHLFYSLSVQSGPCGGNSRGILEISVTLFQAVSSLARFLSRSIKLSNLE